MRTALVVCPHYICDSPPIGLAALAAHLKGRGQPEAACFDLANRCRREARRRGDDAAWGQAASCFWSDSRCVDGFLASYGRLLRDELDRILGRRPGLVGFSVNQFNAAVSLWLARRVKERAPKATVVFGGWDCLEGEGDPLRYARSPWVDAVCVGEGEETLLDACRRLDAGRPLEGCPGLWVGRGSAVVKGPAREPIAELDALSCADYSDFDLSGYGEDALVVFSSRGCLRRCKFCDIPGAWGRYRSMSGRRIYEEIARQTEAHRLPLAYRFSDGIINGLIPSLEGFCDLMAENRGPLSLKYYRESVARFGAFRPITWQAMMMFDSRLKDPLLDKVRAAGCLRLEFGLESGSPRVLASMRKGFLLAQASDVIRRVGQRGIHVHLFMIVGWPTETEEDFAMTLDFVERHAPWIASLDVSPLRLSAEAWEGASELGVATPLHPRFWRTRDGRNDFLGRLGRVARLEACARRRGIRLFSPMEAPARRLHEALYHEHAGDFAAAAALHRDLLGDPAFSRVAESGLRRCASGRADAALLAGAR